MNLPATILYVMLDMGIYRDYYKPIDGATWCEMLANDEDTPRNKHQWSPDGINWVTPEHQGDCKFNAHSSSKYWPQTHVDGDDREFLSSWGWPIPKGKGGCCHSAHGDNDGWGQSFTMAYGVPLTTSTTTTECTTTDESWCAVVVFLNAKACVDLKKADQCLCTCAKVGEITTTSHDPSSSTTIAPPTTKTSPTKTATTVKATTK